MAFHDGVGQGFVGRESWGGMHYAIIVAFVGLLIGTSSSKTTLRSSRE